MTIMLLLNGNQKYRQAICNLRVNNTKMVIGRYKWQDGNQSIYNTCNDNCLGDEYCLNVRMHKSIKDGVRPSII